MTINRFSGMTFGIAKYWDLRFISLFFIMCYASVIMLFTVRAYKWGVDCNVYYRKRKEYRVIARVMALSIIF